MDDQTGGRTAGGALGSREACSTSGSNFFRESPCISIDRTSSMSRSPRA